MDTGSWLWLFVVFGGAILLGLGIAWGMAYTKNRTPRQKALNEQEAREIYEKEDQLHRRS